MITAEHTKLIANNEEQAQIIAQLVQKMQERANAIEHIDTINANLENARSEWEKYRLDSEDALFDLYEERDSLSRDVDALYKKYHEIAKSQRQPKQ